VCNCHSTPLLVSWCPELTVTAPRTPHADGRFSVRRHLWGSGWWEHRRTRGDLVALNAVSPHAFLLLLVTCITLTFPCAAVTSQLTSRGGYLVISLGMTTFRCLYSQVPFRNSAFENRLWNMWRLVIIEEISFPTPDSAIDEFTCTVLRASEQCFLVIHQTRVCSCPVVEEEWRDAMLVRKFLLRASWGTLARQIGTLECVRAGTQNRSTVWTLFVGNVCLLTVYV
jgi:hypothetical protein